MEIFPQNYKETVAGLIQTIVLSVNILFVFNQYKDQDKEV